MVYAIYFVTTSLLMHSPLVGDTVGGGERSGTPTSEERRGRWDSKRFLI